MYKVLALTLATTLAAASAHARTDAAAQRTGTPSTAADAPDVGDAPATASDGTSVISVPVIVIPSWWWTLFITSKCQFWDGTPCTSADMANPYYRQILILPSGFAESERADFWTEFDKIRSQMATAGNVWSTQYRNKILWVGYFIPGGALNTPTANFGAAVLTHPVRGYALSLSQDQVRSKVAEIKAGSLPNLSPLGVGVLFNSFQDGITANASPPSFTRTPYGIAKFNRLDLASPYITTHELAHASMNFLDEYMEPGFQEVSIRQLDLLTPLVLFDGSWGGFVAAIGDLFSVYDYNISEVLANNGNVNIALSPWPQTTGTGGQWFGYEGGMFFGRGTFHVPGNNLMDSNRDKRHDDDGFAYDTTAAQQQVIDTAFNGNYAYRANDRLRNAGPRDGWPLSFGSTTTVMMFDGDKNHQFHPTQYYGVQVGWYERIWDTCWWGPFPYPCYHDDWRTAQKTVWPSVRYVDLRNTAAYGLAGMVQDVLCAVGVTEIKNGDGNFKLCDQDIDQISGAFLPTLRFFMPYQSTTVPASQWFTTYWWRFYTYNGTWNSYYTGWSSFYRSL